MLAQIPRPIIFAHRGASVRAPENTLASFRLALEEGAPAVELDAKLTADGQVVVLHDATLERTTNGHGPLSEHSLAQVRELDAGSKFSPAFTGERIPTLAEVFELAGGRALINVELTNYAHPNDALVEKVVGLVREHHLENGVIFSSFNPLNLVRARQLIPEVPLGLLVLQGRAGWLTRNIIARFVPYDALHPHISDVNLETIKSHHRQNKLVNVWTVNQPEQMRQLSSWGVDGIFTDDPALALEILGEKT